MPLDPPVRRYLLAVVAIAALAVTIQFVSEPPVLGIATAVLGAAAAVFGSRIIKFGPHINVGVSHPFIFAALILEGPSTATLTAIVALVGGKLVRRGQYRAHHLAFNIAAVALSALGAGLVYAPLAPEGAPRVESAALPALAAAISYSLVNTVLVTGILSREQGRSWLRTWSESSLWLVPSTLASGAIGLLLALGLEGTSGGPLVVALPICYLMYYSYQLYQSQMREKKARIEAVEKLNAELEEKVRERTGELMRLNLDLRSSNEQLERANRHKSEFLANVSHELRTPLNAIIGFSDLLASETVGGLTPEQREFVDDIHTSGQNLLALINDILDLAKVEAGKLRIRFEPSDPVEVAGEVVSMVRVLALNKRLDLLLEPAPDLEPVAMDPVRVRQVLWNLLSNAIKFTPERGTVRVTIERLEDGVEFAVEDTGIGIPAEELGRIFEQFHQVDGSPSRRHGGTGLGLALARKLVDLHGGQIDVTSTPGEGSRFRFTIPGRSVHRVMETEDEYVSLPEAAGRGAR